MINNRINFSKLIYAAILFFGSVGTGISGYILIEDYTFLDAFYMTILTVSTVGFQEVHKLSDAGKLFTAIYIFFNLGIIAYIISIISTYVFEGELRQMLTNYRTIRKMKHLKDHIIVCGFGRNGNKACEHLIRNGDTIVVIDTDEKEFENKELRDNKNIFLLKGDATHDEILENAGIANAKALITTLPKDADNVFVTLTARQLNINIQIISRASEISSERKLIRAGASNVVMPDAVGGRHMATLVTKPDVIEFLEMMNGIGHDAPKLDKLRFDELKDKWKSKSISEMNIRQETGATVIAIKDKFGFTLNPDVNALITEGQTMIVLGYSENLEKLDYYKFR